MPVPTRKRILFTGGAFDPSKLAGLKLWLRADAGFAAPLIQDDDAFTRANGASLGSAQTAGGAWTAHTGTWGIASNQANLQANATDGAASLQGNAADGVLTCDITTTGTATRINAGVCMRVQDGSNFLFVRLFVDATNNTITIQKRSAGTDTVLATKSSAGLATSTTYTLKVVMRGSQIDVYLNGTWQVSYTLSGAEQTAYGSNTRHGLYSTRNTVTDDDGGSRWDNFKFVSGYSDGDTVDTWTDQSGNGFNAAQTVATEKPVLKNSIVNGKPVVRFTASANQSLGLSGAGLDIANGIAGGTLIMVVLPGTAPASQNERIMSINTNAAAVDRLAPIYTTAGKLGCASRRLDADSAIFAQTVLAAISANSAHIYSAVADYAGGKLYAWDNGASEGGSTSAGTAYAASGNDSATSSAQVCIGDISNHNSTNPYGGDIAEIIFYNRALSDSDRRKVEKYLGAKYGIAVV